jgi:hypothetical protein
MAKPSYFKDVPNSVATADGSLNYAINGRLDPSLLRAVSGGGMIHVSAWQAWMDMKRAFDADPSNSTRRLSLSYTGIYRTYTRQVQLLYERSHVVSSCAQCSRRCYRWQGGYRCLNRGAAPFATPGTSNHGWGLAVDTACRNTDTGGILSITPAGPWMERHAGRYGFFNETGAPGSSGYENWHYTYVWGDLTPPYRQGQPPPPPPPPGRDTEVAQWARFQGDTTQPYDIAFTAVGWRRLTPAQVGEQRYIGQLKDGQTVGYPAILPAAWKTAYPEVNRP